MQAAETQEARYAARVGHGKAGVVFVNVYRNTSSNPVTFTIQTASSTALRTDSTNPFWLTAGLSGGIGANTAGAVRIAISDLGEWIRWDVTGPNAAVDFDVMVDFYDRS